MDGHYSESLSCRQSIKYHPSVWGDYFIQYDHHVQDYNDDKSKERIEELKEQVRSLFKDATTCDLRQTMYLVDSIQLLGLKYHFEKEVNEAMERIYAANIDDCSLFETALWFRLLRQHGYNVSSSVFIKFKYEGGSFWYALKDDAEGLLSLYNAAFLGMHGETILDEAVAFSRNHLKSLLSGNGIREPLASQVSLALDPPLPRKNRRLLTRLYISIYEKDEISRDDAVLQLAKLDFNQLQSLHFQELKKISMWEVEAVDGLPEYLKDFYSKLINSFEEFENELAAEEKYRMAFLKEEMKSLARNYHKEARWCAEKYVPTVEEHLKVSMRTIACSTLFCTFYVGMGEEVTEEAFKWIAGFPKLVKASSLISRVLDDINSHQREQERDHVVSTVECCMKEHNVEVEEAYEKLLAMVEDAWKEMNEECFRSMPFPRALVDVLVNATRSMEDMYEHIDSYTNSTTTRKDKISLLFSQPIN